MFLPGALAGLNWYKPLQLRRFGIGPRSKARKGSGADDETSDGAKGRPPASSVSRLLM